MGALLVQAHAPLGVACDPVGVDLAGVLASRMVRLLEASGLEVPGVGEDLDLPLAVCDGGAVGWHWAAGCSTPTVTLAGYGRRARVIDPGWLAATSAGRWPTILASKGPYKDRVTPYQVRQGGTLTWRAVGDAHKVAHLLAPVRFVGKCRGVGEGMITSWSVSVVDVPVREWGVWVHTRPDGSLGRACPVECATTYAPGASWSQGLWGLRPPVGHHQATLAVPAPTSRDEEDPWL